MRFLASFKQRCALNPCTGGGGGGGLDCEAIQPRPHDAFLFKCGRGKEVSILTLSLPECLMGFCKVTLTFESMDEIL